MCEGPQVLLIIPFARLTMLGLRLSLFYALNLLLRFSRDVCVRVCMCVCVHVRDMNVIKKFWFTRLFRPRALRFNLKVM